MVEQPKSCYTVTWMQKMADIPQDQWDALALPLQTPFLEWEWLHRLETSGSAIPRNGWQSFHLTIWRGKQLVAAAPLYLKGHSYGEFVFDHQWADLSHRLGVAYYPKLLGMIPFTPATGYRFLVDLEEDEDTLTEIMVAAIDHFCDRNQISGCNFLFVDPQWQSVIERQGFTGWLHHSYIWSNQNFHSFDDYLKLFNSNQRKNIKRERKAVEKAGLEIEVLRGEEIPKSYFPLIYKFYSSTCQKFYWGSQYLTRKFFSQLYENYRDRVLLVVAYVEGNRDNPVGMSFCLIKGDKLYGRYWGCLEEFDSLHFEACYYKPIEYAIANGIQTFDPGAGGRHKKRRGFPATPNYSMHRFYNPRIKQILSAYIDEINEMEQQEITAINAELPFNREEIKFDL